MKTHHLKKYIILALIIQSCAPTIKIVDRHPNNQKKSSEVYRSKYFGEALQKRLEYFRMDKSNLKQIIGKNKNMENMCHTLSTGQCPQKENLKIIRKMVDGHG